MRIFISTGEVSGDLQGSLLIRALKRQAMAMGLELEIFALGGEKMLKAGAIVLGNTSSIGSMGILEGLPYILPTLQVQRRAIASLKQNPPDLVVLIDYMNPNIGIGTYMKRHLPHVPVVYYIGPQEWAWSLSFRNSSQMSSLQTNCWQYFPKKPVTTVSKGQKLFG